MDINCFEALHTLNHISGVFVQTSNFFHYRNALIDFFDTFFNQKNFCSSVFAFVQIY
ncbi:hypothetical protein B4098_1675 [Heyndrickxia coagulans]|uniref:Uncharacterized protein n=1 Tax=Heyndrickxia coagulans TaxID=1398 RepID=A0A150K785_HEYCO|nr:hypothetical protein B4098_1675 [Heyndrickxia coagulans]